MGGRGGVALWAVPVDRGGWQRGHRVLLCRRPLQGVPWGLGGEDRAPRAPCAPPMDQAQPAPWLQGDSGVGARGSRREGRAPQRGHIAPNRPNGPPCQEPTPVSGPLCALGLPSSPWQRFNGELRFYPRQPPARVAWGARRCPLEERPGAEKLPLHPPRRCLCLPICLSRCCSMCCLHSPASRRGCASGSFPASSPPPGLGGAGLGDTATLSAPLTP